MLSMRVYNAVCVLLFLCTILWCTSLMRGIQVSSSDLLRRARAAAASDNLPEALSVYERVLRDFRKCEFTLEMADVLEKADMLEAAQNARKRAITEPILLPVRIQHIDASICSPKCVCVCMCANECRKKHLQWRRI